MRKWGRVGMTQEKGAKFLKRLAGAGGFEPPHGGTKIRCLTAWLRPIGSTGTSRKLAVFSRGEKASEIRERCERGANIGGLLPVAPRNIRRAQGSKTSRFAPLFSCFVLK